MECEQKFKCYESYLLLDTYGVANGLGLLIYPINTYMKAYHINFNHYFIVQK